MIQKPLLAKSELIDFVMKRIREATTTIIYEQSGEELNVDMKSPGGEKLGWIKLDKIWYTYQRTGNLNDVIDYINAQIEAMRYMQQVTENPRGVNIFNVFPAVRPPGYVKENIEQVGSCYHDQSVPGLDTVFLERKDGFLVVLNDRVMKPVKVYMNEAEIKQQAYDNLRKTGWVEPSMLEPGMNVEQGGMFRVYHSPGHPFHHQFLLQDMYTGHLPDSFLVAFPGQFMAVVLTIDDKIQTPAQAKRIAERSGMIYFVKYSIQSEPRPLSNHIYWVQGNKRYWLKGVEA